MDRSIYKNMDAWLDKKLDYIDEEVEDLLDNQDPDIGDEEIQDTIAECIDEIIDEDFESDKRSVLKNIVINMLVEGYVRLMFGQWYTGEASKDEYIDEIKKRYSLKLF